MPRDGAILLGDWIGKADSIEFACNRCSRTGRLTVVGLLDRFGADAPMTEVLAALSADCPRRLNPSQALTDLCGIHTPQASRLF
jgi:hypothetical protein